MEKRVFLTMCGALVFLCIMKSANAVVDKATQEKAREEMMQRNGRLREKHQDTFNRMHKVSENKDFIKERDKLTESINDKLLDLYDKYDPGLKNVELKYNQDIQEHIKEGPLDMLARPGLVNAGHDDMFARETKLHENKKFSKEWKEIEKSKDKAKADLYDKYDPGLGKLVMKRNAAFNKSMKMFRKSMESK